MLHASRKLFALVGAAAFGLLFAMLLSAWADEQPTAKQDDSETSAPSTEPAPAETAPTEPATAEPTSDDATSAEKVGAEAAPAEVPASEAAPTEVTNTDAAANESPNAETPELKSAEPATESKPVESKPAESKPAAAKPAAKPASGETSKSAGKKYDLKYKFKPSEVIRWEVVHQAVVDTTIQNTNQTAETRSTSIKVWKVESVSPQGQVVLTHSVESIDMWQKMQGRAEVRYNSLKDEKPPVGYEDVAKAVGVPLTVLTLDQRGKMVKRQEKLPQPNAGATIVTVPFPDQPIEVGHTWSVPLDIDVSTPSGSSRKIETRQQFKLEKVNGGFATIDVDTVVLTPIQDPAIEAQLVQRMVKGPVNFDIDRGMVVSQQMDLDRHVIGFSGPASSMHYVTRMQERMLRDKGPIASGPKPARQAARPTAKPKAR